MKKSVAFGLFLLMGPLSGCFPPQPHEGAQTISEPKKNYLRQETKYCTISYEAGESTLTGPSKSRLLGSLKPLKHVGGRYKASVHVSFPDSLSDEKRQDLNHLLEKTGLTNSQIHRSISLKDPKEIEKEGKTTTEVILRIDYYLVVPPTCGKWDYGLGYADGTIAPANYGCATTRNHALMVSDPVVFFQGQDRDLPDGEFTASSVNNYRSSIKKTTNQNIGAGPAGPGAGGNQNGLVGSGANLGGAAGNLAQQTVGNQANAAGGMLAGAGGAMPGAPAGQ